MQESAKNKSVPFFVRALADRGMVKVQNFKKSEKKLTYAYVLTPRVWLRKLG